MKSIEKKEKVQREALATWINNKKQGTVEIITGLGKTFIFLHALYTMPKDKTITHLFLAEVKDRKNTLLKEIAKYNLIFKRDVLNDYNLKFACYQKAYKMKGRSLGLIGCDEIHDALTPNYSKFFFNNNYRAILGMSAKIKKSIFYITDNRIITKGSLLNKIAPICYTYTLEDSLKDNTSRELNIHIIKNTLDCKYKNILFNSKNKSSYVTEYKAYKYWNNRLDQSMYLSNEKDRDREFNISRNKRTQLLYDLVSKVTIVKRLLSSINGKSIIFGNSIPSLLKVTPNVISNYNTDNRNNQIKEDFNTDKIKNIAGFKKLKQGENLINLSNCIIMSYYSNSEDLLQRIGRLRDNGEVGNVFIIVTENTQEQLWFDKMLSYYVEMGNIIYHENIEECLKKIN